MRWRYPEGEQRIVIELKMLKENDSLNHVKAKALEQTSAYSDACDGTESHILIFDGVGKTDWKNKVYAECCEHNGYPIKVWGV